MPLFFNKKSKTMKYRFQTLMIALLMALSVSAQTKNADQLLDELGTKTNSYKNIKVTFAYTMKNEEAGIDETTNGTLIVSGEKYHLNIAGQEVISDGKTLWTYLADSEEVQVNDVDPEEGFSPSKLLSSYNKEYNAKKEKDLIIDRKSFLQLKLKPKDKDSNFDFVILVINQDAMQLSKFIIHDFEGNIFTYDLKQFVTNSELPADSFTFDPSKYPDVEVIDMR